MYIYILIIFYIIVILIYHILLYILYIYIISIILYIYIDYIVYMITCILCIMTSRQVARGNSQSWLWWHLHVWPCQTGDLATAGQHPSCDCTWASDEKQLCRCLKRSIHCSSPAIHVDAQGKTDGTACWPLCTPASGCPLWRCVLQKDSHPMWCERCTAKSFLGAVPALSSRHWHCSQGKVSWQAVLVGQANKKVSPVLLPAPLHDGCCPNAEWACNLCWEQAGQRQPVRPSVWCTWSCFTMTKPTFSHCSNTSAQEKHKNIKSEKI